MPNVEAVRIGEENSIENVPTLSEEELSVIKKKMEAIDKIFSEEQKARYKIEIIFGSTRSPSKPTPGALSFWESGAQLHGGGDTKMYICAGKALKKNTCEAFIPDSSNGYGYLVCPKCKEVWKGEDVSGEIFARLTMRGWAELILKYFARLGHNADIYAKHPKEDIRTASLLEQQRQLGGEKLYKSRLGRSVVIYPLKHLIKDVSNGADLLSRLYAFLVA